MMEDGYHLFLLLDDFIIPACLYQACRLQRKSQYAVLTLQKMYMLCICMNVLTIKAIRGVITLEDVIKMLKIPILVGHLCNSISSLQANLIIIIHK